LVKLDEAEFQALVDLGIFHIDHLEMVLLFQLAVVLALEELVATIPLAVAQQLHFLAITV
jgi:hypothetical protein